MKDYARYAIGILLLIGALIILVIGFNLVRNLFKGDKPAGQQAQTKKVDLLKAPEKDQTVQYTIVGPIVGEEEHHSIRIKIDRDFRTIEVLQGYDEEVIKSQEIPNNLAAYEAFTAALNGAGFTNTVPPEGRGDEKQACPLGRKFNYEVEPGTSDAFRSWSSTCSKNKEGTFSGNRTLIQTLFQRQIPDYNKYISDVRLG